MSEDPSPSEIVRWLERIERKADRNGESYASRAALEGYRELADAQRAEIRQDIEGIKEGLRWAVRLGVTMVFTNLGALIFYLATRHSG